MINPGGYAEHADHEWKKRGECVHCVPCGIVLYQGNVPKDKKAFASAMNDITLAAMKAVTAKQKKRKKK